MELTMAIQEMSLMPEARADLLCYLVATAAATHSLTSDWRVDHVVISCRSWLGRHALALPWLERVRMGQLALRIARRDLRSAGIAVRQADVQALFTGDMRLNTASTVVQRMWTVCRAAVDNSGSA
jgi:hypothetical protein